jgi:PGF-CTERM protein
MALLLVGSIAFPIGAVSASSHDADASAYAGTHVEFNTTSSALTDYSVDGETVVESMSVQSESQADITAGISLDLVTQLSGSAVSVGSTSQANASASVTAESGATLMAHDSERGILVINSSDETQYVAANVSGNAETEVESDSRVVVTTENDAKATFIAVGDADVTVNDAGNVSAMVEGEGEGKLVLRSYSESEARDENAEEQEELIANGTAAAEVYVRESAESSGEFVAGTANYSQDTAVEVTHRSEGQVNMTAERTESEGRVVITSVSEAVISSAEDVSVMVDGEAAAEASSYGELESATQGEETSKFLVRQSASAEATADVLVALNHFSERDVTVTEDDGGDGTDDADETDSGTDGTDGADETDSGIDDTDETTDDGSDSQGLPGFGVGVALIALLAAALLAARNR